MGKRSFRKTIGFLSIIISAFFSCFAFEYNYNIKQGSTFYVFLFAGMFFLFKYAFSLRDKRICAYSLVTSFLLSCIQVIGKNLSSNVLLGNALHSFSTFGALIGWTSFFYGLFMILFSRAVAWKPKNIEFQWMKRASKNKAIFFLGTWFLIFLAWVPYFIVYYPGVLSPDSMAQIGQVLGETSLKNHHPIAHTYVIKVFISVGKAIGDLNIGVALYSLFQMLTMSCLFAFTLLYLKAKKIKDVFLLTIFLFYALYPVTAFYSITMWKDVWYSCFIMMMTLLVLDMLEKQETFFLKKRRFVIAVFVLFGTCLMKNMGIYVVIISMIFAFLLIKKSRIKIAGIFAITILLFLIYRGPIFTLLQVEEGSTREALSVPLQQFARVVKYRGDELKEDEWEIIHSLLPLEMETNIGEIYDPHLSDPVKDLFNQQYYDENKFEVIKTWAAMFFKYPSEYIAAFLDNSYGYYYSDVKYWLVVNGIMPNVWGLEQAKLFPGAYSFIMDYGINRIRDFPVLSMIYSIGFHFTLMLLAFVIVCVKKQYRYTLMFIPVIAQWLTCLASPVYAEFRYIYALFISLPILISVALHLEPIKQVKHEIILPTTNQKTGQQ